MPGKFTIYGVCMLIAVSILSINAQMPDPQKDTMYWRVYDIWPSPQNVQHKTISFWDWNDPATFKKTVGTELNSIRDMTEQFGVSWPPGSTLQIKVKEGKMLVFSTSENMKILDTLFKPEERYNEISFTLYHVEYSPEDIDAAASPEQARSPYLDLFRSGKGRVLFNAKIMITNETMSRISRALPANDKIRLNAAIYPYVNPHRHNIELRITQNLKVPAAAATPKHSGSAGSFNICSTNNIVTASGSPFLVGGGFSLNNDDRKIYTFGLAEFTDNLQPGKTDH